MVTKLALNVDFISKGVMRFKLTDAEHRRWEVPIELFNNSTVDLRDADYDVLIEENPFNFKATRKLDDQLLFELGPKALF